MPQQAVADTELLAGLVTGTGFFVYLFSVGGAGLGVWASTPLPGTDATNMWSENLDGASLQGFFRLSQP